MPHDLFGEVVHREVRIGARRWYGLPLTVLVHTVLVGTVVIVPLVATDVLPVLPAAQTSYVVVEAPSPPPGPPPAARRESARTLFAGPNAAPVTAPAGIAPDSGLVREPEPGTDTSVPGGLPGSLDGAGLVVQPEAPPPAPPPTTPVRITTELRPPAKIKDVLPIYPELAMRAHVAGSVVLEATINAEGRVVDVRVLRSIPLLDKAAVDAVRQWEFTPTRLNGVAVPVIMTVTVNFTLR
jgi:protein TonB